MSNSTSPHFKLGSNVLTYRQDIDGLRAIAILSVLIFHTFPKLLPGGFIGVDIFFVISGFLITGVILQGLHTQDFSFSDFYGRRIRRIFPALLLVLLTSYAYGWFHLMAEEFAQLGKHIAGGAGFISNFVLWNESGYFDKNAALKPLLNLWSLGIEEQYYIFWPFLLWGFYGWKASLKWLIIVLCIVSFGFNLAQLHQDPVATFYSPLTRVWELLIGSFLAYQQSQSLLKRPLRIFATSITSQGLAQVMSGVGLTLILVGFWTIRASRPFPGWWGLLPTLGAFLLIAAGPHTIVNRLFLANPLMVGIGKISYPLYLWHWPILVFGAMRLSEPPSLIYQLACVALAVLLATMTYFLVEKPIRFKAAHRRLKTVGLVVLMSLIGYVGYNCFIRDGIAYRHKDFIQQVSGYQFDKVKEQRQHECFIMDQSESLSHFATSCLHTDQPTKIVLWGDSHGGSIYPGFAELEKQLPVSVSQLTIAGCGGLIPNRHREEGNTDPVIKFCNDANAFALEQVLKIHPQFVVIHKSWQMEMLPEFKKTIQFLQEKNLRVIVIGPTPVWTEDLPRIIYKYWKTHHELPPTYFDQSLNPDVMQIENALKKIAEQYRITYYSAYQRLCSTEGCLVMIPQTDHALTTMDEDHITPAAGRYIVQGFTESVIQPYLNQLGKRN